MKDLAEVVEKVKGVEDGITNILKDTVKDSNQHNKRFFVIIMMLILALVIISVTAIVAVYKQNEKYAEFLSQFEFETETVYQQTDDYSDINSGINISK